MSELEFIFEQILLKNGIGYRREVRFHKKRKWRFDFLIGDDLAVELEGGVWTGGRHIRPSGFAHDMEKYNAATVIGYRVLRYHKNSMNNFLEDYKEIKKKERGKNK